MTQLHLPTIHTSLTVYLQSGSSSYFMATVTIVTILPFHASFVNYYGKRANNMAGVCYNMTGRWALYAWRISIFQYHYTVSVQIISRLSQSSINMGIYPRNVVSDVCVYIRHSSPGAARTERGESSEFPATPGSALEWTSRVTLELMEKKYNFWQKLQKDCIFIVLATGVMERLAGYVLVDVNCLVMHC